MKIIWINNENFINIGEPICCAIGNFDGVHLGHQQLIKEATKHGLKSGVLTFDPHPSTYLKNMPNYPLITPVLHKAEIIESFGIDYMIVVHVTKEILTMPKNDFMANLKKLGIEKIVTGYDFTFGNRAEGTIKDLEKEFDFYEVKKFMLDGLRVSSTHTRECLQLGEVENVKAYLGRTFSIRGTVVEGNKLGRTIGYPTANVDYNQYFLPKNGVYFVKVKVNNQFYYGMANIGHNPTFNFQENRRLEVNIFDFNQDIYGEKIEIFFITKIRDEKKYSSKDELISTLNNDKNTCINFINSGKYINY